MKADVKDKLLPPREDFLIHDSSAQRGKALLRRRGELLDRPFAHLYKTGRMRRIHLRGWKNILKRILIHVGALNLGLMMRSAFGIGTPRTLQGRVFSFLAMFCDGIFDLCSTPNVITRLLGAQY